MGECLDKSKLLLISPKVEVVFEVEVELGKYFLTLINATYFYYNLRQGGEGNQPPPPEINFWIDFAKFVFTGA